MTGHFSWLQGHFSWLPGHFFMISGTLFFPASPSLFFIFQASMGGNGISRDRRDTFFLYLFSYTREREKEGNYKYIKGCVKKVSEVSRHPIGRPGRSCRREEGPPARVPGPVGRWNRQHELNHGCGVYPWWIRGLPEALGSPDSQNSGRITWDKKGGGEGLGIFVTY